MSTANASHSDGLESFDEAWSVDFEFHQPDGGPPEPICMVAREYKSGETIRLGKDALRAVCRAPFAVGPRTLFVAYYASAELGCFLALGWPLPARILDLCAEFRCLTSGQRPPCGHSLLGALTYFGLDGISGTEKEMFRALAMRGGPYSQGEQTALLGYCESDVVALTTLLPEMLPKIVEEKPGNLGRALLRGRYMSAAAQIESVGVPIDKAALNTLRRVWPRIKHKLIAAVDVEYGVFVPVNQRPVDPGTVVGDAILRTAAEWEIDPHDLADALEYIHAEERKARVGMEAALAAARKATGLTASRIVRWESTGGADGRGRDYSSYPGFDVRARELAAEYPELGIGEGYREGAGYDDADYASRLWPLLRDGVPTTKPKHDPDNLRRAAKLVVDAAVSFQVADGPSRPLAFSAAQFAKWLARNGIPWPRLDSGALALDQDTFREMARAHPMVATLRELRDTLAELRLESLTVGRDGRNRCLLSAFASKTGRNQPSNSKFIFGPSVWLRGLIRPDPGYAVAYIDYEQQEFGIAAALSGDAAMMAAYATGDPYLAFAKQAGAVPTGATKQSHGPEREQFKACVLAVQYGMGERSLAERINQPQAYARELLRLHRSTYPTFWRWSQAAVDHAMLHGWLETVFGWTIHVGLDANPRSLANFPMQANGAEMLRLACCLTTERGIRVCAPVHDAVLVEAPVVDIDAVVAATQAAMREASEIVLDGFALRTEAEVIRYPDRYMDPRGTKMWETVWRLVHETAESEALDQLSVAEDGFARCCAGAP